MDESKPQIDDRDVIDSFARGLQVIEAFSDEHVRLTPSEAARLTGMTRTAARRYLLTLVRHGYADTDGKLFWLTPRVMRLSQSYLEAARLPRLVQPFIQRISMQSGETVNVSVLDGHEVVYVARSSAPRGVSIGYQAGVRVPAHVVAPGIVMLSAMADDVLDSWIDAHAFGNFTSFTVTDRQDFRRVVLSARAQNHWITAQQFDLGLCGVAMALKNRKGELQGAISMTVQTQAYNEEQVAQRLLPLLQDTAQTLRALL
ncbi:IclR family transcriptional regulator C-terminal domain-containing protein [Aquabacterium sp.]|jgi:IclR family pca regulon transcriptional regulator|uniref:IclR family transcriptional regulator domain-containing protein n=1 Tax=Aquabacterium sp. TaxID=1872578 RepID=UPI0025C3E4B8|nr:IclR family transcriptional regulator C-terminal domain-containing protein [Aquabacterium sp.]